MAFLITFTLLDAYGRITTKRFECAAESYLAATSAASALANAFDDVSDLGIWKAEITAPLDIHSVPLTGANVDVGATLDCILDNNKGYPLKIPGIKAGKLNADGSVKLSDSAIQAYVDLFQSGGNFTVSEGDKIVTVRGGSLDK